MNFTQAADTFNNIHSLLERLSRVLSRVSVLSHLFVVCYTRFIALLWKDLT